MVAAILAGVIIGFIVAMPPGPVGLMSIRFGLHPDRKHSGSQLALGAGVTDFFFCLIAIFASSAAQTAIDNFSNDYPLLMLIFQIAIVLFFMFYGIFSIRAKTNVTPIEGEEIKSRSVFLEKLKHRGPFLLGIAISLTNVPSPTYLPSFALLTANVHKLQLFENIAFSNFLFAAAFGLGNSIWLLVLFKLVVKYRQKISALTVHRIRQFAGFTFIGFGTFIGYRLLSLTKWSEIMRIIFAF
ncbi:MAG: hypothetical protein HW421_286 [Ignavibacteria bacterium]|nr:hypothetical protein [Ignavibacteria bacterium]